MLCPKLNADVPRLCAVTLYGAARRRAALRLGPLGNDRLRSGSACDRTCGHRGYARDDVCLRHTDCRGERRSPLVPPRRPASLALPGSSASLRPFGCSPSLKRDCRSAPAAHPAIPAPVAVLKGVRKCRRARHRSIRRPRFTARSPTGSSPSWRRGGCRGCSLGTARRLRWGCRAMPGRGGAIRASMS